MDSQVTQIAARIKKIRRENELSSEWAAKAFNITVDELESYESGEVDIPVSFLYMAAKKYGVDLSMLLTGDAPHENRYAIVRNGEGVRVHRSSEYDYLSLCADFAHKKVEPLIVTVPFSKSDAPLAFNTHAGQEFHYILKGKLQLVIDQEEIVLNEGDSIIFNSELKHALKSLNDPQTELLVVII